MPVYDHGLLNFTAIFHSHHRVLCLVVLLVEDDASQRLIDPSGPLVEALVDLLALVEELISVDSHDTLRARMAQNER